MAQYKKILMGLDIGTDSVGWCATDENGQIIKKNGKSLWGYHGFESAETAAKRRSFRSERRRLNRRKERINLLRDLMKEEIDKIDPSFFYRLDNSFLHNEDREMPFSYTIFNDKNYTDKDYYKNYPTIYHLRKELIHNQSKADIRLIYLALHHMIKYRGNFLNNSDSFKPMDPEDGNNLFYELIENLKSSGIDSINYNAKIFNELKKFVTKEKYNTTQLKEKYNSLLNPSKSVYLKNVIIPLLSGSELSLSKLEVDNIESASAISKKICVKDETFDSIISSLVNDNPNQNELINAFDDCKKIFDFFLLGKLLGEDKFLSDAMVKRYDIHKKQLKELKDYIKKNCPEKKNVIFRVLDDKINNYAYYIGSTNHDNVVKRTNHISQKDFYSFLKTELGITSYKGNEQDPDPYLSSIVRDMNNGDYLLRQNDSNNGVFPYQINKMEMEIILNNQSKYYPFLLNTDEYGSIKDKIISILQFKIPYYVGPLISFKENDDRCKFAWVEKTNEKITPWNFDKVVNKDKTAESFIKRMLNKCTYLPSKYCLPKNSIIFSYYNCLSVLNKMNLCGRSLSYEDKMELINNLYKKKRNVSKKDVVSFFANKYKDHDIILTTSSKNVELKELNCDMASYVDFVNIFGETYVNNNLDQIESIIRDIVIFEDKSILQTRLEKEYHLEKDVIKKIKGLNYSKYASISKELLTDIYYVDKDESTGEVYNQINILSVMEKGNQNLQEIIYDEKYHFNDLIVEYNKNHMVDTDYHSIEDYVEDLGTVSPDMKRPLIRAYKICEEVEKILGQKIDEYYVECTRTNKEKKVESKSRQSRLLDLYNAAIKATTDLEEKKQMEILKGEIEGKSTSDFQSDRIYLYYSQMGRCMYSGKPISFDELFDNTKYEIDHIYPQSLIKDDSLKNNRVLVSHGCNQNKKDIYPIPHNVLFNGNYNAAIKFFTLLKKKGFISEEKYKRLCANEITETELESFINRQLVSTNQAVKGFINAIQTLKSTDDFKPKVVYSKSENVTDFRHNFNIIKSRNINNFHHAHDAYLNIMVGRTLDVYFKKFRFVEGVNEYLKYMHDHGYTTNVMRVFYQNKNKTKKDIYESGNLVWKYTNNESLKEIIKNIYYRFDILSTERAFYGNEILGKVTILPSGEGNVPVKGKGPLSDCSKYGGFKQHSYGSYCLLKVNNKGTSYILEPIPTSLRDKINEYLDSKYKDYEIIVPSLKNNTVFYSGKLKYVITGKSGNCFLIKNKNERIFSQKEIMVIHKIEKLAAKTQGKTKININEFNEKGILVNGDSELILAKASNDRARDRILKREELIFIYDRLISIFSKEIYSFSASQGIVKKLTEKRNLFLNLSMIEENVVIMNLLDFLKCNQRKTVDLSLLDEAKDVGAIYYSKNLKSPCKIVYESITGFYKKVVFELK